MSTTARSDAATNRRVAMATMIGTTIEWYDFFIYGTAAGLVFSQLFFAPAGPRIGLLLAFATVGISFVFRPLGAVLAGNLGERYGRRAMLVLTLLLMGGATSLIGLLPTYETAGLAAPVLLLVLRILQGVSAGGEWGGAVLMAAEHAPSERRAAPFLLHDLRIRQGLSPGGGWGGAVLMALGHAPRERRARAGAFPQLGVPLGMLLASGVTALMTGVIAPGPAFVEWGWRVPFLLSVVLIVVGYVVRRSVDESPIFAEMAERKRRTKVPVVELFRRHWLLVVLAALV